MHVNESDEILIFQKNEIKSHASFIRLFLTTSSLVDTTEELELLLGLD